MEGDYACKYTRVLDWFREFEMNAWLDSSQEHYIDKFVLGHCAHILETQILRTFQSAQGAEQEKLGWCLIQSIRMTVQLLLHSVSTTAIGAGHVPLHLEPIRFLLGRDICNSNISSIRDADF